jgi:hypothetical protein
MAQFINENNNSAKLLLNPDNKQLTTAQDLISYFNTNEMTTSTSTSISSSNLIMKSGPTNQKNSI